MKIEGLYLKNFLSHESTEVVFNDDVAVNVIIGQNGAGKTSLIQGIIFSIFREADKGNQADLVRKGAVEGTVKMKFKWGNRTCEVIRHVSVKGKAEDDTLVCDGIPRARGIRKVSDEMVNMLGVNGDLAKSTFIVREGKIMDILEENILGETLSETIKADKLNELTDSNGYIRSIMREVEKELEIINELERQIEDDRKYLELKRKELNDKKEEMTAITAVLDSIKTEENALRIRYDELKKRKESYIELNKEMAMKRQEVEKLNQEIESLSKLVSDIDLLRKQLESLKSYKEMESEINSYSETKQNLEKLRNLLENQEKEIKNKRIKLKKKEETEPFYYKYLEIQKRLQLNKKALNDLSRYKGQLDKIKEELDRIQEEVSQIDVEKLQQEIEDLIRERESKRKNRDDIQKEIGGINSQIEELDDSLRRVGKLDSDTCPICGSHLDEEHKQKIQQEKESKLIELKKRKEELKRELEDLESKLNSLDVKIESLKVKLSEIKSKIDRLAKLKRDFELISNKIEDYDKIEFTVRQDEEIIEKEDLEAKFRTYLSVNEVTEEEIRDMESEKQEIQTHIEDLSNRLKTIERKLNGLTVEQVREKIEDYNKIDRKIRDIEKYEEVLRKDKEKLSEIKNDIEEISTSISRLNYNQEEYNEVERRIEKTRKELEDNISKRAELQGNITQLEKEIEQKEKEMHEKENRISKKQAYENSEKKLEKLREDLGDSGLKKFLIESVIALLVSNLNDILGKFDLAFRNVNIKAVTSGRTKIRTDFKIEIYNTKGDSLSIDNLSGGEKISLALALRLALTRIISNPGFIILDEPTVHLDEERRKKLIEIIKSVNNVVPQILVITHDEEVLDAADVVFRVTKENGVSKVRIELPGEG